MIYFWLIRVWEFGRNNNVTKTIRIIIAIVINAFVRFNFKKSHKKLDKNAKAYGINNRYPDITY
jgi:hypothetical protein